MRNVIAAERDQFFFHLTMGRWFHEKNIHISGYIYIVQEHLTKVKKGWKIFHYFSRIFSRFFSIIS